MPHLRLNHLSIEGNYEFAPATCTTIQASTHLTKTVVEAANSLKHLEVLTIQQRLGALIAQSTANNLLLRNGFKVLSQHVEDGRLGMVFTTPRKSES